MSCITEGKSGSGDFMISTEKPIVIGSYLKLSLQLAMKGRASGCGGEILFSVETFVQCGNRTA